MIQIVTLSVVASIYVLIMVLGVITWRAKEDTWSHVLHLKESICVIDPHKLKYHPLYWSMVEAAAAQSVATRHQVGAIVVTPTGMISVGWNGMPAGMPNECESIPVYKNPPLFGDVDKRHKREIVRYKTNPEVIHAERNALDKMARTGVPAEGSLLFVSRAPCLECAKALHGLGLKAVYYRERHDDMRGVELLDATGTPTFQIFSEDVQEACGLSAV